MADRGGESGSPVIGCPVRGPHRPMSNQDWWPDQPDLRVLRQPSPRSSPVDENFSYAEEFKTVDVEALAAREAGHDVSVPFAPGRTDTTQELTHVVSFAVLEPKAGGFRNYLQAGQKRSPQALLVDRAAMLTLTVPEMTVLTGGMRALNANYRQSPHGVLTTRLGQLTNDFFVNLPDIRTEWTASAETAGLYEERDHTTGEVKWTATAVDLVFGSSSELRAVAEVYASADAGEQFVCDFVAAWDKVMNLDRFDLTR
jgi:catalase-peroxidase